MKNLSPSVGEKCTECLVVKVVVNQPLPGDRLSAGSVEDTLLLLEIIKEKKQQENRELKVSSPLITITLCNVTLNSKEERIRQMALEQKQKRGSQRGSRLL